MFSDDPSEEQVTEVANQTGYQPNPIPPTRWILMPLNWQAEDPTAYRINTRRRIATFLAG